MAAGSKSLLWLIPVIALLGVIGGAYWLVIRPQVQAGNAAENTPAGAKVPDLGSRGKPLANTPDTPANEEVTATDGAADGGETEPEPEFANSAREIDIWLNNLALATRAADRKGIALNHDMLKRARPDTLVDERVRAALDNEQSAWVRIQFMQAFHDGKARFEWAMHVYDNRTAKFLGTDDLYVGGEIEELKMIGGELFAKLVDSWRTNGTGDFRLMALVRNALDTEKPLWLLDLLTSRILLPIVEAAMGNLAQVLREELRNYLLRRTAERGLRECAFAAFIMTFEPRTAVIDELQHSEWWDYASVLPALYPGRFKHGQLPMGSYVELDWVVEFKESADLPKLFRDLLAGSMPAADKQLLIQRITKYAVPGGGAMIEDGLARKDANYPDYLTAFGWFADAPGLQRLTAAADEPDVATAQGAIEGLRQSFLPEADAELRKVIESGSNPGVKSQALGALLSRTTDTAQLLEEYLDVSKDASLRAVAVQHVPLTSVARLQRVVEEDPSPTVRLAALNRVGGITPSSDMQKKDLHGWFVKIKDRDNSPVIRAAARKYAEGTQE